MFLPFFPHLWSWLKNVRTKLLSYWSTSNSETDQDNQLPDLTRKISRELSYPIAHGSLADVWKCSYVTPDQHLQVAVKSMRIEITDDASKHKITEVLLDDYRKRKQLQHQNVLPLLGFSNEYGPFPAMVSPWMDNGSLTTYLSKNFAELTTEHKIQMLQQVASAIGYLHSKDIVHGDLTSNNILIDLTGTVQVADHGIFALYSELAGTSYIRSNVRWIAPELFEVFEDESSSPPPKPASDIYSFGCIMLQVMTGQPPYADIRSDHQVTVFILRGKKPSRPSSPRIEDSLWNFIQKCWGDSGLRPSAVEVLSFLQSVVS